MTALRPQFVLFGDSITQRAFSPGGWASALADAYTRRVDIVNRGYSGYNSRWALTLLDYVFPPAASADARLATVFFGANDAALPDRPS
jgi:lysophospholipase L1-like esterase